MSGDEHAQAAERGDLKGTTYEFFVLGMSILSIVNLALVFAFEFESQSWLLVTYVDSALTLVFLIDFGYRLKTAPSRRHYFFRGGGILGLLSCVPFLRIFRLFRVVRAVRIVRRLGGPRVFRELKESLASGAFYRVVFVGTHSGGDMSPGRPSATATSSRSRSAGASRA